jgi:hypothetical protein
MIITKRLLVQQGPYLDWNDVSVEYAINHETNVVIVIDSWNDVSNYDSRIPPLNNFLSEMRASGSIVCFSPYYAETIYKTHPLRKKVTDALSSNSIVMPPYRRLKNVQRPVKVSHMQGRDDDRWINIFGSRVQTNSPVGRDHKIHDSIITDSSDIIAWNIREVLTYMKSLNRSVESVIFCGKHLNWCVLNRPLGMEEWKRYGFETLIVKKDCVASTNDPREPPYCSQEEMDELHFRFVESFWGFTTP